MRKCILLALVALLSGFQMMNAVPARPGKVTVTQPDGTRIVLQRHGDEWGHWMTDALGRMVRQDENGFYRVVSDAEAATVLQQASTRRNARRNAQEPMRGKARKSVRGQRHFLVILVEFSDLSFKEDDPNQAFTDLMNEPGYSVSGGTGSARDYYYDNSHGDFEPVFDVYGPVKLKNKYSYYGKNDGWGNDTCPEDAVIEGCQGLDDQIDFSRYDSDGDGVVDLVFMYYAGKGEADGGGTNCIWPHQWELSSGGINLTLDGKKIDKYACTNEIVSSGALKNKMCGIGTACHEFGHAMGLPDFYDTDYDEYNGEAGGLYDFSTMCGGSYNNGGRTPPYFNMEERILLGWVNPNAILEFGVSGSYTLTGVNNNVAYKTLTDQAGEYFLYECRSKTGWDAYIPEAGLIVYHVDKSDRYVTIMGSSNNISVKASALWSNWSQYNSINENGSHPCFYVVPSGDHSSLNYEGSAWAFTGASGRSSFTGTSWNGVSCDVSLSDISYASNQVTFYATVPSTVLNYNVIANPGNGVYSAGSNFALELQESAAQPVSSVAWYFDDEPFSGTSVTLTAGTHVVEAHLTLTSGETKILELTLEAQ